MRPARADFSSEFVRRFYYSSMRCDDVTFCSKCGGELLENSVYCTKCGTKVGESSLHKRSRWWYLLPILFSIVGGVISYFIVKENDPVLAKNCLILGAILTIIGVVIGLISAATSAYLWHMNVGF